ncbi:MAG: DUF2304 domain-containing protein [Acidobacteria bacterium]|nr:DUF2304 domain-containing protein [Acidobacteriota bacterium]
MERIRIVAAVASLLLVGQSVRSVRREHIRVEYSMAWLGAALLLLVLCLSDAAVAAVGRLLGVRDAALVILTLAGVLLLFLFLRYSIVVSSLKDHNIQLAQKVGMLEWEIERLNKQAESKQDAEKPGGAGGSAAGA